MDFVKRILDLAMASVALVVLSPLIAVIAIAIKLSSPGPILFRQRRLGKHGAPFTLYKFRTMRANVEMIRSPDGAAFVRESDPRLTAWGRLLRDFTLDEIPQLFNVLKGDMSVIGPRPDLVEQFELYDELMRRKLEVKPGMACLSLIEGRNSLPWRKRIELDVYYVDHRSLTLDARIFVKGCISVLLRRGVYDSPSRAGNQSVAKTETHSHV
jgi:lipopolysaccharide/colanic/teichoic acid biosynthesis glycosyltransferase